MKQDHSARPRLPREVAPALIGALAAGVLALAALVPGTANAADDLARFDGGIGSQPLRAGAQINDVKARIAKAAKAAGRDPATVILIAVSKNHDATAAAEALACGQRDFGENRVQEAQGKWPALKAATRSLFVVRLRIQSPPLAR